ncbi:MAG: orotidine-5'-phosphate decarboxylase, partial [Anaerolineae bacterium]|nr:orotidine-5'-phosphate decarboxylase [Anaerolineae bacterium]
MDFWQKLETSIRAHDSLLCVGLDPRPERIPAEYKSVVDFNKAIIDATKDLVCMYKPNVAFYEALGEEGMRALRETLAYIPDDIPVLLDAKRNDIASTAAAYAKAAFEVLGVDALTVTPYFGKDGVSPFLEYADRGVFVLCKTSNPSAAEIQDWSQGAEPLYQHVAHLAKEWSGEKEIGLVIGGTYPEAIAEIREHFPEAWFLVPGIGAQGGDLEAALRAGLREDGMGIIVNVSRSIIYASDPRNAAQKLVAEMNRIRRYSREKKNARYLRARRLALALWEAGCVQFGDFVLHSGARSPVYIDLRKLVSHPGLLGRVARAYARLLQGLSFDRLAAIPYAALPIGTAVALQLGAPLIYPRKEVKGYCTRRKIEGEYQQGERVVVLDDLITSGASKLEAIAPLEEEGLVVEDIVVLIDREQGGSRELAQRGYHLHSVLTLRELVGLLEEEGVLSSSKARQVYEYLQERAG